MSRLNARGQLVSAVGDGLVSIRQPDGGETVIGRGGSACWEYADGRSVLYNGHDVDGSWQLLRYDVATGQTIRVAAGGSFLAVSEGRWAVQTPAGLITNVAVAPGSVMNLVGTDGRGASGPAGEIALCDDPSCTAFTIYAADGSAARVAAVAYGLCLLGPSAAVWTGGAHNYALRTAVPLAGPIVVPLAGEDWIIGWADGVGLVAQINGADDGYVLASDGTQFDYDARAIDGALVVAWSVTNAEAPGQARVVTVDRTRPRVPLKPVSITVPAIGRECLIGWYHFGDMPQDAPGNCDLQVDGDMLVRDRATGRPLAAYAAGSPDGDVAALDAAILARRAAHPDLPVLAYWTAAAQRVRVPIGAEIVGVESYMHASETLAAFELRVRQAVAVCPCAVLIGQDYTSNTDNTTDVVDLVAAYARILASCRNLVGLIVFSAGARATGYDAHPETHAAYAQLAAGVTGLPVLPSPKGQPARPVPAPRPAPVPRPAPLPTPVPSTLFPAARPLGGSMQAYLKIGPYYTGVNPTAQTKDAHGHPVTGDAQFTPYFNRPGEPNAAGGWEAVELTPLNALQFAARYVEANRQCSIGDDGSLQSRPAGAVGPWETFYCTTQPDGSNLLYRFTSGGALVACVLTIEETQ